MPSSFFDNLSNFVTNTFDRVLDFETQKLQIEAQNASTSAPSSPAFDAARQIDSGLSTQSFLGLSTSQLALAGGVAALAFVFIRAVK